MAADRPFEYLDVEDLVHLARRLLGDPPPIRDLGLLGSAASRPRTSAFGVDAYDNVWRKAAALLQSIVGNHALIDGNKRLGWLATGVLLELNGVPASRCADDDVFALVSAVAAGTMEVDDIAQELRRIVPQADGR